MKESVPRQIVKKPKGILLSLLDIVFRLAMIIIASTMLLMIFKIGEAWIANQSNAIGNIFSILDLQILKTKMFLKSLVLVILIMVVFLVDGLVQRDIRKFQFARESTYLFHRSKLTLSFCFYVPMFVYFASPHLINTQIFFCVMAVVLGIIIHFSVKHFKKYL